MDELKITKEKVLAAAAKCPTAKEVLKEMFPEVFKQQIIPDFKEITDFEGYTLIQSSGIFDDAFCLGMYYKWRVEDRTVMGTTFSYLIPTRK